MTVKEALVKEIVAFYRAQGITQTIHVMQQAMKEIENQPGARVSEATMNVIVKTVIKLHEL